MQDDIQIPRGGGPKFEPPDLITQKSGPIETPSDARVMALKPITKQERREFSSLVKESANLKQEAIKNSQLILIEEGKSEPNKETLELLKNEKNRLAEKKAELLKKHSRTESKAGIAMELAQVDKDLAVSEKLIEKQTTILNDLSLKRQPGQIVGSTSRAKISIISWLRGTHSNDSRSINSQLESVSDKVDRIAKSLREEESPHLSALDDEINALVLQMDQINIQSYNKDKVWDQSTLNKFHQNHAKAEAKLEALKIERDVLTANVRRLQEELGITPEDEPLFPARQAAETPKASSLPKSTSSIEGLKARVSDKNQTQTPGFKVLRQIDALLEHTKTLNRTNLEENEFFMHWAGKLHKQSIPALVLTKSQWHIQERLRTQEELSPPATQAEKAVIREVLAKGLARMHLDRLVSPDSPDLELSDNFSRMTTLSNGQIRPELLGDQELMRYLEEKAP